MDLNADLGEGFGAWRMADDQALLGVVTSASIACGFHAGDPRTMAAAVEAAARRGVNIGAHVAYPDLVGFGRRPMSLSAEEVLTDTLYQVGALAGIAARYGAQVRYVKPHGALYHAVATDHQLAEALAEALALWPAPLWLMVPSGTVAAAAAAGRGVDVVAEGFADRAYLPDGTLLSRSRPGAVLQHEAAVVDQALSLASSGTVTAVDGSTVVVPADTICVHGDTPGALSLAARLRGALERRGFTVAPFR